MTKKLPLETTFGVIVPLGPDQLITIKQDKKYENVCHVQTTIQTSHGKFTWFTLKHSAKEVLHMYYNCKYGNGGIECIH